MSFLNYQLAARECGGHSLKLSLLEAKQMKSLLIVLSLCVFFSSSVYAKKPTIKSTRGSDLIETVGDATCKYESEGTYSINVHAHKNMAASLKVLFGDEVLTLYVLPFLETTDTVPAIHPGPFYVPRGQSWSVVWVLESTRGKGHVIDADEMNSGTCDP